MSFAPAWARGIHGGADERPFFSESEAETGGESDGDDSEDGAPLHSCDAIALRFFQTVGVVTGAVAVLSAMTNGAILVLQPAEFKECALRLYTMVFSALVIAAEMDAKRLLVDMSVMDNWFCRGLFYVFVGLLPMSFATGHGETAAGVLGLVLRAEAAASMVMALLGVLYALMGISCMKHVKEASIIVNHHKKRRLTQDGGWPHGT